MKAAARRLSKVEASLTPKQQVLRWLDRMFSHGSQEAYTAWLVEQPVSEWPRVKMPRAVERAVRDAMRGELEEATEGAVRNAVREVYFLTKLVIDLHVLVEARATVLDLGAALCSRRLQFLLAVDAVLDYTGPPGGSPAVRSSVRELHDELAGLVSEVCGTQQTVEIISRRYFDGHPVVFPAEAGRLADADERAETVAAEYNRFVASAAERLGLGESAKPARARADNAEREGLSLDLAAVREAAVAGAMAAARRHVDLARADALWDSGRPEDAARLLRACGPWGARP